MAGNTRPLKRDASGEPAPQIFDEAADDYQYAVGTDGRQHAVIHTPDGQPVDFGAADLRGLVGDRPTADSVRPGTTYWSADRVGEDDEIAVSDGSTWEPLMAPDASGGGGDMRKSEYDSNGDGTVNAADSVPWTGVTGKPSFGTAAATDASAYATAAQGALADSAVQPGDIGTAAAEDVEAFATAAQGALADSAVQPAAIADFVTGDGITDIVALTQAEYDGLTPDANTLYVITD